MAAYTWALPTSLIGAALALAFLCLGARPRIVQGVLEVSGGMLGHFLGKAPTPLRFCAMTLGHVIIGVSPEELQTVRRHEHVHVRQCERWGALFLPAYLLSSLWQLLRGRHPYRDNVFEREAYGDAGRDGAAKRQE